MNARIADEVEVLRWCIDWLARLERGEMVAVNLRPDRPSRRNEEKIYG
jgi:hypothetical protein